MRGSVIKLYEKYRLKDGRVGRAVEILGQGEACIFEVDKIGLEDRLVTVTQDEINEKEWNSLIRNKQILYKKEW